MSNDHDGVDDGRKPADAPSSDEAAAQSPAAAATPEAADAVGLPRKANDETGLVASDDVDVPASDSTASDSTASDSTASDSTASDSTAADSTASDSTASDSASADSTASDGTASTSGVVSAGSARAAARRSAARAGVSESKGAATPKRAAATTVKRPNMFARLGRFLREVVAELRKVIWPSKNQMVTYTIVVIVFVVFMVALVGVLDLLFAKGVLAVFG